MEHSIKILNYEKRFINETFVDRELAKQKIADIDQALQLLQTGVSGSNLQKYLVRYTQLIEAPHALLDDEVVIRAKVVEVSNPTEINDLIKNIVDIKQIS